jgi:hypothetical protein
VRLGLLAAVAVTVAVATACSQTVEGTSAGRSPLPTAVPSTSGTPITPPPTTSASPGGSGASTFGSAATNSSSAPTAGSSSPAATDFSAFRRQWFGHDRSLTVSADGTAVETYFSGCCPPSLKVTLSLAEPQALGQAATATATVTAVTADPGWPTDDPLPKVGDSGRVLIIGGLWTDTITQATFCDGSPGPENACGA